MTGAGSKGLAMVLRPTIAMGLAALMLSSCGGAPSAYKYSRTRCLPTYTPSRPISIVPSSANRFATSSHNARST